MQNIILLLTLNLLNSINCGVGFLDADSIIMVALDSAEASASLINFENGILVTSILIEPPEVNISISC